MRCGVDSLAALVQRKLEESPFRVSFSFSAVARVTS
jgi:hypothetical protein